MLFIPACPRCGFEGGFHAADCPLHPDGDICPYCGRANGHHREDCINLRISKADVDFGRRQVRLTTRKRMDGSMEEEWVPMVGDLFDLLLAHRQVARGQWVFTQSVGRHAGKPYTENRGFPQELCRRARVKPFGCHSIRHLTASILAGADVPMVVIQGILRHKKLSTTERYVRRMETVRPYLEVLAGGKKRTESVPKVKPPKAATSGGS